MVKRIRTKIIGRVQGVFFRASTREQAVELGIRGFVRNLEDGSVELEAEGEEESLHDLLRWCQHGPPSARVDKVEMKWIEPQQAVGEFAIRP